MSNNYVIWRDMQKWEMCWFESWWFCFAITNPDITGSGSVSGGLSKPPASAHLTNQIKAQYNSPQALYSEENIRDVLDQQSETLAGGVRG